MASADVQAPKILIVGSGPAGLILALTLRRNGVPVRVIEKTTENRKGQRGAGIMPRTLELYEALGVYEQVISRALTDCMMVTMYKMPEGVEIVKEFEFSPHEEPTPSTPYNNLSLLGQDNLDKILRAELAKTGCEVELGVELVDFEQFDDHVKVKLLKHLGEAPLTEEASYEWVIGADGAKGTTRKVLGLKLLGETTTTRFVTGDCKVEGLAENRWHIWGDIANTMLVIRGTENEGLFNFMVGGSKLGSLEEICSSNEAVRAAIKESIGQREDVKLGEFTWVSPYTVNIRMTEEFQKGRVFLIGDAAHVHSPAGGQGMNTSVQDAFNLGWKLALVSKGLSPPSLLKTFSEERIPVVSQMLKISTALLKKTMANSGDQKGWDRSGNIKQLGVNYRWSSIVVDDEKVKYTEDDPESTYDVGDGVVRAGNRAPDAPGLVQIGSSANDAGASVRLFKLFSPARHTVLIFSANIDYQSILDALQPYSGDIVRSIIIAPAGKGADIKIDGQSKAIVVEDKDGHAQKAYAGAELLVIRPDGVVGARIKNAEGVKRYFQGIFVGA